jgi:acetylornithine deacetylase
VVRETRDAAFEPPYTTVNVGLISGGKAKNIIPGSCKFVVEWRPIPSEPVEQVEQLIEGICLEMKREDPTFEARIQIVREDLGVDTRADSPVVRFLVEQSGNAPATVSFGTEAPHLTRMGAEAVVFGPGDIKNAHQTGEFVPVAELVRCREILGKAIAHFCGK